MIINTSTKTLLKTYINGELLDLVSFNKLKNTLLDFSECQIGCQHKKCRGICYLRQNLNWVHNQKGMNTLCGIMTNVCRIDIPRKWKPREAKTNGKQQNINSRRHPRKVQPFKSAYKQEAP